MHPEFAACATLPDLLDRLNIPHIARTSAQRLAERFGSLEAIIAADWLDLRQVERLTEKAARPCATTSINPRTPSALAQSKPSCGSSACIGKASGKPPKAAAGRADTGTDRHAGNHES